jgi:transposase-like protein
MVAEIRPNYPTEWAAMKAVAAKLGIGAAETVRTWVRKSQPPPIPERFSEFCPACRRRSLWMVGEPPHDAQSVS